jgi:hypothetical protein
MEQWELKSKIRSPQAIAEAGIIRRYLMNYPGYTPGFPPVAPGMPERIRYIDLEFFEVPPKCELAYWKVRHTLNGLDAHSALGVVMLAIKNEAGES